MNNNDDTIVYKCDSVFLRGSYIYGTENKNSDYDFIGISDVSNEYQNDDWDLTVYTEDEFIKEIYKHNIAVLECLWSSDPLDKRPIDYSKYFKLNKPILRKVISQKANHSWVKAKKKIKLEDEDTLIGLKSLFHSFRIIDFGIQIATKGKIIDYSSMNDVYHILMAETNQSWDYWEKKFKKLHNNQMSVFRSVCPKK